jgi:hypothetical protein
VQAWIGADMVINNKVGYQATLMLHRSDFADRGKKVACKMPPYLSQEIGHITDTGNK